MTTGGEGVLSDGNRDGNDAVVWSGEGITKQPNGAPERGMEPM